MSTSNDADIATRLSQRSKPTVAKQKPPAAKPSDAKSADARPSDEAAGITDKVRRDAATLRNAVAFTQAVGILIRSPHYKQYKIADLEWLLLPPITHRQFRIGEVKLDEKQGGASVPASLVLWALVSPEVDKRLSEAADSEPQLRPDEWKSGDIPWLVYAAGETRFVRPVVKQLMETTFKNRTLKVLGRDKDNRVKVHVLDGSEAEQSIS